LIAFEFQEEEFAEFADGGRDVSCEVVVRETERLELIK
jgi:hypothetical protein